MENIVDALKIAASVLIFVIAIGTSFTVFGKAKQTADAIISSRNKQAYLEEATLDGGVLYTSSESIEENRISGVTTNGDRIVDISDVISTISRYAVEQYAVTIIDSTGKVLARFDSITESQIINNWDKVKNEKTEDNKSFEDIIKERLSNSYINNITLSIEGLYKLNNNTVGQNWYGSEEGIKSRINKDIYGGDYTNNGVTYKGKGLLNELKDKTIIEVIKEIDNSHYLNDGDEVNTELLQQYEMPTIEIIYIIK